MNRLNKTVWTLGILVIFLIVGFSPAKAQGRSVSLQTFYDELSYHGDWINNPDYGYVWRPNVGNDFRPYYTNGRWLMTEYGNTWVSDYSWGWAPFHYGRWFYDDYDGWIWLPDTEWGPAWVDWRTGGGYYGWAPMGPRITVNINIGRRYYPDNYWIFIPQRHIYANNYYNYWRPNRNVVIIKNTTIINNVYVDRSNRNVRYNSGPRADDIRRVTRQNVTVHKIADASKPGSSRVTRGTVNIYRPQVDRSKDATPRAVASNSTSRPSRADVSTTNTGRANTVTSRDNNANSTNRPSRGTSTDSRSREADNPRVNTPTRSAEPSTGRSTSESRRPSTIERTQAAPQRPTGASVERGSGSSSSESRRPERTERSQPAERSSSSPQRVERSPSSGNAQRQSAPQQRTERPSAPQRVERSAPSSPSPSRSTERSSSGGGNSSRSSGGNSRPSR